MTKKRLSLVLGLVSCPKPEHERRSMHPTRLLAATFILCGLPVLTAPPVAAEGWKQVGLFSADSRNLAVGKGEVRVVSQPDVSRLGLSGEPDTDLPIIEQAYPGWDLRSDLVVLYRATSDGFVQDTFYYEIGADRKPFPGDPIAPELSVFDHTGERRAEVPRGLKTQLGSALNVVAAASLNWDGDSDSEWVVVIADPRNESPSGTPVRVSLLDRSGDTWEVERSYDIKENVRVGPLEVRDVTGDKIPDIVLRCFHQSTGHYWVDAYIYSQHEEMREKFLPFRFNPDAATSVIDLR
jgi:hypothetical protein